MGRVKGVIHTHKNVRTNTFVNKDTKISKGIAGQLYTVIVDIRNYFYKSRLY